jgi:hypothetical protein
MLAEGTTRLSVLDGDGKVVGRVRLGAITDLIAPDGKDPHPSRP